MSITAYKVEAVGHDRMGTDFGYVNIMYRYGDKQPCPCRDQCEKIEVMWADESVYGPPAPGCKVGDFIQTWLIGSWNCGVFTHREIAQRLIETFTGLKLKELAWFENPREKTLKNGKPRFRVLNYAYAIDKQSIYTSSGRAVDVHLSTFQVLDSGQNHVGAPQGYAKDCRKVCFHNGDGKVKCVRNAAPSSFYSLGDTFFAIDKQRVYAYGKPLTKVDLSSWELLSHWYSRDAKRLYYLNREITDADKDSFKVYTPLDASPFADHLARDQKHFFWNDEIADEAQWFEQFHQMDLEQSTR